MPSRNIKIGGVWLHGRVLALACAVWSPALQVKGQVARSHCQARESSFYPFFYRAVFVCFLEALSSVWLRYKLARSVVRIAQGCLSLSGLVYVKIEPLKLAEGMYCGHLPDLLLCAPCLGEVSQTLDWYIGAFILLSGDVMIRELGFKVSLVNTPLRRPTQDRG